MCIRDRYQRRVRGLPILVMAMAPWCVMACLLVVIAQCSVLEGASDQYSQKIPGNSDGYYDDTDYLLWRVMVAALIGIFVGLMSCVCFFCFCCVQVCTKCGCECIKKTCSCCGAGDPAPEGYTRKQRLGLLGVLLLGWACVITGSALGFVGNADVKDGLALLSTTVDTLADQVYDQVQMGYDAAVLVTANSTVDATMLTDAETLRQNVKDGTTQLTDSEDTRVIAVYVFYGVMMAVPMLGFLSWVCGSATLSYVMTQKHVYGEANALTDLLQCGDTSSSLSTYEDVWQQLDEAQTSMSGSVQEISYGFSTNTYSSSAAVVNSAEYARNKGLLYGMYNSYGVEASTCESLTDPTKVVLCFVPGVNASTYQDQCFEGGTEPSSRRCLQQTQILAGAGMTGSSYLIACEHLNHIASELNNNICEPMVGGLVLVCAGQTLIGFFYFFVLAVGCMGMNRFNKENDFNPKIHPEALHKAKSEKKTSKELFSPLFRSAKAIAAASALSGGLELDDSQENKLAQWKAGLATKPRRSTIQELRPSGVKRPTENRRASMPVVSVESLRQPERVRAHARRVTVGSRADARKPPPPPPRPPLL
eukprot:TRINITY_DN13209_c0_g1_i1.p1 TRINITY_DN13209_c0_g1~~TRINITY_DN13209_c0_g1_i1.p1  ORF type:complete len:591 (+),score=103.55 TRINITY_DN13209_c0_g1_i1:129-1901(+)